MALRITGASAWPGAPLEPPRVARHTSVWHVSTHVWAPGVLNKNTFWRFYRKKGCTGLLQVQYLALTELQNSLNPSPVLEKSLSRSKMDLSMALKYS